MNLKNRTLLANTTQGLLWIGSFAQLYIASDRSSGATLGFTAWGIYTLVFFIFIYMAHNNSKSGVVLKKNFKDAKEFKERKKAGEKNDTLEGDEFVRNINYKAAYSSFRLVAVFMISIWLLSFLLFNKGADGEPIYLLETIKASSLLWIMFAYVSLTGIVQLYKASPEN